MSLKAKLLRGSLVNLIDHALKVAVVFFTTPLMVEKLGDHNYGLWLIALTIIGYLRLLDLGLSFTGSRFLSQAVGSNNETEQKLHQSNLCFLFSRIAIISLILSLGIASLPVVFPRAFPSLIESRWILLGLGITTSIRFWTAIYPVILKSHLRYDLLGYSSISRTVIQGAAVIALLLSGHGLHALTLAYIATDILDQVFVIVSTRKVQKARPPLFPPASPGIRPILKYSTTAMLATFGNQLRNGIDPLVVGRFTGISNVPAFSIGTRFLQLFADVINTLFGGNLLAAFSQLNGRNDPGSLSRAFLDSTRVCTAVAAIGGGALLLFTPPFIHLWLGPEFSVSGEISSILTVPTALMLAQYPANNLLYSKNEHRWIVFLAFGGGLFNAALSIYLAFTIGIKGPAIATALELLLFHVFLIAHLCPPLANIPRSRYLLTLLGNLLPYAAITGGFFFLVPSVEDFSYGSLTIMASAYLLAATVTFFFASMNSGERTALVRMIH